MLVKAKSLGQIPFSCLIPRVGLSALCESLSPAVSVLADQIYVSAPQGHCRQKREADSGYPPAMSHFVRAKTFELAQHKPGQMWHLEVSLERARLHLGEGAEPRLVDAEWSTKTFDVAHQSHLSRLT
jgi:hypothetical protein